MSLRQAFTSYLCKSQPGILTESHHAPRGGIVVRGHHFKGGEFMPLPVAMINPNPKQPRKYFDAAALSELSESIKAHGLKQPIVVRPHPSDVEKYEIVMGERRWRAHKLAGIEHIPAIVQNMSDSDMQTAALIENVVREQMTPMEESRGYKALQDLNGWTIDDLKRETGKSKQTIENKLSLTRLIPMAQQMVERGTLPERFGVEISKLDAENQARLMGEMGRKRLQIADVRARVNVLLQAQQAQSLFGDDFFEVQREEEQKKYGQLFRAAKAKYDVAMEAGVKVFRSLLNDETYKILPAVLEGNMSAERKRIAGMIQTLKKIDQQLAHGQAYQKVHGSMVHYTDTQKVKRVEEQEKSRKVAVKSELRKIKDRLTQIQPVLRRLKRRNEKKRTPTDKRNLTRWSAEEKRLLSRQRRLVTEQTTLAKSFDIILKSHSCIGGSGRPHRGSKWVNYGPSADATFKERDKARGANDPEASSLFETKPEPMQMGLFKSLRQCFTDILCKGIRVDQPHHYDTEGDKRVRKPGAHPNEIAHIRSHNGMLLVNLHAHKRKNPSFEKHKALLKERLGGRWQKIEGGYDTDWERSGWAVSAKHADVLREQLPKATWYASIVEDTPEEKSTALPEGLFLESYKGGYLIRGNTYPVKDALKQAGARWNGALKAWIMFGESDDVVTRIKAALKGEPYEQKRPKEKKPVESPESERGRDEGDSNGRGIPGVTGANEEGDRGELAEGVTAGKLETVSYGEELRPKPTVRLNAEVKASLLRGGDQFQVDDTEQILSAFEKGKKGYLLANDTGTGKTFIALAALAHAKPKSALIVVPNRQLANKWAAEAMATFGLNITSSTVKDIKGDGLFITTYDDMRINREKGGSRKWDWVIFDESQNLSDKKFPQKTTTPTYQAGMDLGRRASRCLYMSATPFQQLWELKYLEKLGLWENFDNFLALHHVEYYEQRTFRPQKFRNERWSNSEDDTMMKLRKVRHIGGVEDYVNVFRKLNQLGIGSNREVKLDSKLINNFSEIHLTDDEVKTYRDVLAAYDRAANMISVGQAKTLGLQRIIAARRLLQDFKLRQGIDLAKQLLKKGKSVSIFVAYNSKGDVDVSRFIPEVKRILPKLNNPMEQILQELGGPSKVGQVHGNTTVSKRTVDIDSFQAGRKKALIATISSGGTGLSLHDTTGKHPRAQINIILPWSGSEFKQLAGRSHRLGSKSETEQYWLLTDLPEERHMAKIVAGKLRNMGAMVKGIKQEDDARILAEFDLMPQSNGRSLMGFGKKPLHKSLAASFTEILIKSQLGLQFGTTHLEGGQGSSHKGAKRRPGHAPDTHPSVYRLTPIELHKIEQGNRTRDYMQGRGQGRVHRAVGIPFKIPGISPEYDRGYTAGHSNPFRRGDLPDVDAEHDRAVAGWRADPIDMSDVPVHPDYNDWNEGLYSIVVKGNYVEFRCPSSLDISQKVRGRGGHWDRESKSYIVPIAKYDSLVKLARKDADRRKDEEFKKTNDRAMAREVKAQRQRAAKITKDADRRKDEEFKKTNDGAMAREVEAQRQRAAEITHKQKAEDKKPMHVSFMDKPTPLSDNPKNIREIKTHSLGDKEIGQIGANKQDGVFVVVGARHAQWKGEDKDVYAHIDTWYTIRDAVPEEIHLWNEALVATRARRVQRKALENRRVGYTYDKESGTLKNSQRMLDSYDDRWEPPPTIVLTPEQIAIENAYLRAVKRLQGHL